MEVQAGENEVMERCVEILTGGYVQSFVDFFYLTNKNIAAGPDTPPSDEENSKKGDFNLKLVSEKLTSAEKARRSGNPNAVFENYEELASYFSSHGDPQTSVHFFNKCLKLSQLVNDQEGEKRATFQIGLALSTIPTETEHAIQYHERHLDLASELRDEKACGEGREQLMAVYGRRAKELENVDLPKAVYYLEKLLKVASESRDIAKKAMANFKLGVSFIKLQKPERAIVALTQSLEHAQTTSNIRSQGESCAALADAYLQIENKTSKAIEYLQETRSIAKKNGDDLVQSHACKMLGSVYSKMIEHDQAVQYFEQNYDLVRKQAQHGLVSPTNIDNARALLGISMKNARKDKWRKLVTTSNSPSLLGWKVSRELSLHD